MPFSFPRTAGHRRLLIGMSIDALGSGLFLPFSLLYFTSTTDISLTRIGLALSLAAVIRFPATIGAGPFADRFGARRTVVLSALFQAVGFMAYAFVGSFGTLLGAALLVQIGNSAFWVGFPGLIEDAASGRAQEHWFALIGALRSSGIAVGSLGASLAVLIGGQWGFFAIVIINSASFAASAILVGLDRAGGRRTVPTRRTAPRVSEASWSGALRDGPYLGFVVINVGFAVLSLGFFVGLPVFLVREANLPAWAPGIIIAVNAVLGAIGAVPVVSLVAGRRRSRILVMSQVIIGCGFLCVLLSGYTSIVGSVALALVAVLLVTTTELIQGPVVPAIVNDSAGPGMRGRYTSLFQMGFVIGDLITPALVTALLTRGTLVTWLPFVAIALVDAAVIWLLARTMAPLRSRISQSGSEPETARILEADGL